MLNLARRQDKTCTTLGTAVKNTMPPKSVMVAKRYPVTIADLREYPANLTEKDLAKLLGVSESHARRRRTGGEYEEMRAAGEWPEHHRSAKGRGQVLFDRAKVKAFLEGCPGA
jgi:hypothetical protein